MPDEVAAWAERIHIPTYRIGKPDKNPIFLEKRVYQGSSGVVSPHPVIDRIFDEKEDKQYTAVYLENRYLKIMILPEIGGRVRMAQDKTNGYHFIYYNRVIKPALVVLTGPWISGELNLTGSNITGRVPLTRSIGRSKSMPMAAKPSGVQRSKSCFVQRGCTASGFTQTVLIWKSACSSLTEPVNRSLSCGGLTRLSMCTMITSRFSRRMSTR